MAIAAAPAFLQPLGQVGLWHGVQLGNKAVAFPYCAAQDGIDQPGKPAFLAGQVFDHGDSLIDRRMVCGAHEQDLRQAGQQRRVGPCRPAGQAAVDQVTHQRAQAAKPPEAQHDKLHHKGAVTGVKPRGYVVQRHVKGSVLERDGQQDTNRSDAGIVRLVG